MAVISTEKDLEALSLAVVAEFDAGVERVWQIWEDPRQLERWWGPPTWPATFEKFEFQSGGAAHYFMTGPDGEKSRGWWRFTSVDAPRALAFDDGFADENYAPDTSPTSCWKRSTAAAPVWFSPAVLRAWTSCSRWSRWGWKRASSRRWARSMPFSPSRPPSKPTVRCWFELNPGVSIGHAGVPAFRSAKPAPNGTRLKPSPPAHCTWRRAGSPVPWTP